MNNSLGLFNKSISGELYPDYKVTITNSYPSREKEITLSGLLSDAFSLSAQSNDSAEWSFVEETKSKFGVATDLGDKAFSSLGSAITTTSVSGTRVKWTGTSNPTFSLTLMFSSTASGDQNLKTALANLNKIQYPSKTNVGLYEAPLGYAPNLVDENRREGEGGLLFSINIGTWFDSPNYWTINPSSISIDTIFDENGKPMILTASLELTAWQLPTAKEVNSWFRL